MAGPRTYKTEAVVLKQMPLGEADRIITFYTADAGKVRAVAKGVRRLKSRHGGHLYLLNCVSISLSRGRNLDVVNEAQATRTFRAVREDLPRLSRALYMAELVDGFSVEGSPNEALYLSLVDALQWLGESQRPDLLLRYFEVRLLDQSGYRPEIYDCVECRTTLEPGDHLFSCAAGGIMCPGCRSKSSDALIPLSLNAVKVLRFLLREREYARVEALKASDSVVREIERLLRAYISFLADRELKSAEFMNLVS